MAENAHSTPVPASRRGFLRALASIAAIGSAGVALPVAAAAATPAKHPDQALFDAELALFQAREHLKVAEAVDRAARKALEEGMGPCPDQLRLLEWEEQAFGGIVTPRGVGRLALEIVPAVRPADAEPEAWLNPSSAWMGKSLRRVIEVAPAVLGPAGRTPHHIKRWRGLLPLADARDRHREALRVRFDTVALWRKRQEAEKARDAAGDHLAALVATTPEGLAVKARYLNEFGWHDMHPVWKSLLQSAAAIGGVELRAPRSYERGGAEA